ncbi:hypothetical protein N431DRAFT_554972 [Stipitochalara longipes BDJ]|nr:hypothetical protein N431DRAFT_554972 [Stipitochalara longipes BDJ]
MKLNFFLILPFTAVLGGVLERNTPGCDSDNCARAVTGTRLGPSAVASHIADCSSFQQLTTYYGIGSIVTPTATPTYASACSDPGDSYASACSCWGYPVQTITLYPYSDDGGLDDAIEWEPKK